MTSNPTRWVSRRRFLRGLTLGATAGLVGLHAPRIAAEPRPETTKLTMVAVPGICPAPQYLVEDFLRAEGWMKIRYLKLPGSAEGAKALATGDVDITMAFVGSLVVQIDLGDPVVTLAGIHTGCLELFGTEQVPAVRDLRGKTIAVPDVAPTAGQYVFVSSVLRYVGIDPRTEVQWAVHSPAEGRRLLAEGKVDADLGWPPEPQDLRAKKVGHVLINTAVDRPWSQYFCCVLAGNRDFVQRHPVATKHVLRAFLKATDLCARDPEGVTRFLVDRGYTPGRDYALSALRHDMSFDRWRTDDPADSLRFYALRLQEAGMIRAHPQKIITQGTDWRFLEELKRELKA